VRSIINSLKFLLLWLLLGINQAQAAPPVDAGGIQRDIEQLNSPNLPPKAPPREQEQVAPVIDTSIRVKVTAFDFVGENILPESALQAEVQGFIGQTFDYNGLTKVTKKISEFYRAKGWLAKVYLPPQDIQNGLVTIEINEAKLGETRTNVESNARLNSKLAKGMLARAQQKGAPLNSRALERAMLLINDTPGFGAQATLSPGAQTGETDVTLNLADKPIFDAKIWADNYGSRLLGKARLNGQANFNNLTGWGDQLTTQGLVSRGLTFVQSGYEFPIGYAGTRMNIGGAVSNYQVKGGGLSNLEAKGESHSVRAGLKHPILRSRYSNLLFHTTLESLNAKDEVLGLEITDKKYRALTLGLKGDHSDNFGLGGTYWGGFSLTAGNLDLNNEDDLAVDKITTRIDGRYNKLNFYVGRQQILADKLIGKALLSGQLADGNLGGFEKFSLGGPSGLAGFTVGEAAADQGWMLNLEGKYAFNPQWSASLLADAGGVCQYKNTWAGWNAANPNLRNCYQLASVGFAIGYSNRYLDGRLSYGRQISGNPGLDNIGNDVEGENRKQQLWLQLSTNY
jgi:hemolysin activation/secretion protein